MAFTQEEWDKMLATLDTEEAKAPLQSDNPPAGGNADRGGNGVFERIGRGARRAASLVTEDFTNKPLVTDQDKALFTSILGGATGNAGAYAGGTQAVDPRVPLHSPLSLGLGMLNSVGNAITGDPVIAKEESERLETEFDKNAADYPGTSLFGTIAGSFGLGGAAAKASTSGLTLLSKAGKVGNKAADFLGNTTFGRFVSNATVGAAEGAGVARAQDESEGLGALLGVGGAALGTAVQEGAGLVRSIFGEGNAKTSARVKVNDAFETVNTAEGTTMADIASQAPTASPNQSLIDLARGGEYQAASLMSDPATVFDAAGIERFLDDRVLPVYREMQDATKKVAPQTYARRAGLITGVPRSRDMVQSDARKFFQTQYGEYDKILLNAENADVRFSRPDMDGVIDRIFLDENIQLDQTLSNNLKGELKGFYNKTEAVQNKARADKKRIPRYRSTNKPKIVDPATGDVLQEKEKFLIPKDMLDFRKAIQRKIDDEYNKAEPNRNTIRLLSEVKKEVTGRLNTSLKGFKEVNEAYSSEHSYTRAYERGRAVFKDNVNEDTIALWELDANPADIQGFNEGVARELTERMKKANGETRTARMISRDQNIMEKLVKTYGQDKAVELRDALVRGLEMLETGHDIVGKSPTAKRTALGQGRNRTASNIDRAILVGAIISRLTGSSFVSNAAAGGAARRLARAGSHPVETREMARILSAQGPEGIIGALGDLSKVQNMGPILPVTLGGPDRLLNRPAHPTLMDMMLDTNLGQTAPLAAGAAASGAFGGGRQ